MIVLDYVFSFMLLTNLTLLEKKICIFNTVLLIAIFFVHAVDISGTCYLLKSAASRVLHPPFAELAFGCFIAGQGLS